MQNQKKLILIVAMVLVAATMLTIFYLFLFPKNNSSQTNTNSNNISTATFNLTRLAYYDLNNLFFDKPSNSILGLDTTSKTILKIGLDKSFGTFSDFYNVSRVDWFASSNQAIVKTDSKSQSGMYYLNGNTKTTLSYRPFKISISQDDQVAYSIDNKLYLTKSPSEAGSAIYNPADKIYNLSWSPDNKSILVGTSSIPDSIDVYLLNVQSKSATKILAASPGGYFKFSPDGKYLAYAKPDGYYLLPIGSASPTEAKIYSSTNNSNNFTWLTDKLVVFDNKKIVSVDTGGKSTELADISSLPAVSQYIEPITDPTNKKLFFDTTGNNFNDKGVWELELK